MSNSKNAHQSNPIYDNYIRHTGDIGNPSVRLDVKIGDKVKKARDLTVSEVAYLGIMADFWQPYLNGKESDFIELQNTAFSDKNTHFSIPYRKSMVIYRDEAGKAYRLVDAVEKSLAGNNFIFIKSIIEARRGYFSAVLDRLTEDYSLVFNGTRNHNLKTPEEKLNFLNTIISQFSSDEIQKAFQKAGVEFVEELHLSNGRLNETFEHDVQLYVIGDPEGLTNHFYRQLNFFIQDLKESGISFNANIDRVTLVKLNQKLGGGWLDPITGEFFITKEVKDKNGEIKTAINPALMAYFFSDVLLSTSYNQLLFGHHMFHPNKYKPSFERHLANPNEDDFVFNEDGTIKKDQYDRLVFSEDYFIRAEASRLSASYKRTVIAGATVHPLFAQKYGVGPEINIAVVKDLKAEVFNMAGVQDKVDSHDGAAFASPIHSILENWSLPGAPAGMDKKTIYGDVDRNYGLPSLLKWATFALTNDRRQIGRNADYSTEHLFMKMHNAPLNKTVNIAKYYQSSKDGRKMKIIDSSASNRDLLHTKDIYRFDPNIQKHYLIHNLKQAGNLATWEETEVDIYGNTIGKTSQHSRTINSLYDIDQVFGGAYCEEIDYTDNTLRFSDANNYILADIVCHNNLKQNFTAFIVNKSAMKVGARNVNATDTLHRNNNDSFLTTTVSTQFGGVQMDADQELDEEDVTEMSQMVSALIQNGFYTKEVSQIYDEIGKVVLNAVAKDKALVDSQE